MNCINLHMTYRRMTDRQMDRRTDRQTDRQTDRTDRQEDRQTRQTGTEGQNLMYIFYKF